MLDLKPGTSPQFKQKMAARAQRRDSEHALWSQWKAGDQTALPKLYTSLTPIIKRVSMNFRGNLPEAYIDATVKRHVLKALHTWDPSKAQLNTHIMHRMNKVKRDVSQYQNPGRLAESSHWTVTNYQHVHSNLREELGRDPTHLEVAHAMGKSPEEIGRLRSGTRRDLAAVEGQNMYQTPEHQQRQAMLEDFSKELAGPEQAVFHMTFGMAGHEPTQAKDIAQRLGLTPGRVSQIKGDIAHRFAQRYSAQTTPAY